MEEWPGWRLVLDGVCTLEELNRSWTVEEIHDANLVQDVYLKAKSHKPPEK